MPSGHRNIFFQFHLSFVAIKSATVPKKTADRNMPVPSSIFFPYRVLKSWPIPADAQRSASAARVGGRSPPERVRWMGWLALNSLLPDCFDHLRNGRAESVISLLNVLLDAVAPLPALSIEGRFRDVDQYRLKMI